MRFLGRVLFIIPLSVHVGYWAATVSGLPAAIGRTAADMGTPKDRFVLLWGLTIAAANLTFIALYLALPRMGDPMLKVPGAAHWLSNAKRRSELIERLRGIFEAALLGLNIFFLAVYQMIYQANALLPVTTFPPATLITFFMVAPLLLVLVVGVLVTRGLALDAKRSPSKTE